MARSAYSRFCEFDSGKRELALLSFLETMDRHERRPHQGTVRLITRSAQRANMRGHG
jgi:hypothetical protein